MPVNKKRPARRRLSPTMKAMLDFIKLGHGAHDSPEQGMCAMEALNYCVNKGHWDGQSDEPVCVSPTITELIIECNDEVGDEARQGLKDVIPDITGTHWRGPLVTNIETEVEAERERMVSACANEVARHRHAVAFSSSGGEREEAEADYVRFVVEKARELAAMKAPVKEVTAELRERGIYTAD